VADVLRAQPAARAEAPGADVHAVPRRRVPLRRRDGLPSEHAYLTVLRQAFDRSGEGEGLELYFGATSGEVFGSGDAGASWFTAAAHLPPVFSVRTA
jgi:hypothetical protein